MKSQVITFSKEDWLKAYKNSIAGSCACCNKAGIRKLFRNAFGIDVKGKELSEMISTAVSQGIITERTLGYYVLNN